MVEIWAMIDVVKNTLLKWVLLCVIWEAELSSLIERIQGVTWNEFVQQVCHLFELRY